MLSCVTSYEDDVTSTEMVITPNNAHLLTCSCDTAPPGRPGQSGDALRATGTDSHLDLPLWGKETKGGRGTGEGERGEGKRRGGEEIEEGEGEGIRGRGGEERR